MVVIQFEGLPPNITLEELREVIEVSLPAPCISCSVVPATIDIQAQAEGVFKDEDEAKILDVGCIYVDGVEVRNSISLPAHLLA